MQSTGPPAENPAVPSASAALEDGKLTGFEGLSLGDPTVPITLQCATSFAKRATSIVPT